MLFKELEVSHLFSGNTNAIALASTSYVSDYTWSSGNAAEDAVSDSKVSH